MFNSFSKIFVLLFILLSLSISAKAEESSNIAEQQKPQIQPVPKTQTPSNSTVTPSSVPEGGMLNAPETAAPVQPKEEMKILPIDNNPVVEEKNTTKEEKSTEVKSPEVGEKKNEPKKTEKEQLEGYKKITNWLIDNQKSFEDVIRENAVETKTKWFIEEEYEAQKAAQQKKNTKSVDSDKPKTQKLYHLVKKGDTLYSISKTYNIAQEDILKWNNLSGPEGIQLGKVLTLYDVEAYQKEQEKQISPNEAVDATDVETSPNTVDLAQKPKVEGKEEATPTMGNLPEYKYYRVKRGDTFSSIAKSHYMSKEDLITLNNFNSHSVLSVDQIVKVKSNYGDSTKKDASGIVKDGFIWPVVGRLLIPFGTQEQGLVNEGINIAAKKGTEIKATQEGVVIYIGDGLKSFGNLILVQHDKNWVSAYAHVDEIKVNKGQKVLKGQTIAKVSDSGNVNTPQLHFELRYNVKPMDPLNYLVSYR